MSDFMNKSYNERLSLLRLTTLKRRRVRVDLIKTFNILTNREKLDKDEFFQLAYQQHSLRGHTLKLFKERCRTTMHATSFSIRVVDEWNALVVVDANSVNCFKYRLDRFWSLDMRP